MEYKFTKEYAEELDNKDLLSEFRDRFHFPESQDGNPILYFTGNSLGLQPKGIEDAIKRELEKWSSQAVEGHFLEPNPWMYYHRFTKNSLASLVGANTDEVVSMNNLTVNLHLMMVSFYQPQGKRFKIIMEAGAFPSDQYAIESQVRFHGYDPKEAIIEVFPDSKDNPYISTESIINKIQENRNEIALVLFSGVQYYSGQYFDIPKITKSGHDAGAMVGFDLAHTIGNLPLNLHEDNVDFAVWCSYKYLNSGPGNVSGVFIHERHASNSSLPRFAGWWGHNEEERFKMKKGFIPMYGADGWQLSNVNVLGTAGHWESLKIFDEAGIEPLRTKSILLTGYLEWILNQIKPEWVHILTPSDSMERGCQISLFFDTHGKEVFENLQKKNVFTDWREPNVIRLAPVPLYNSFMDVFLFGEAFKQSIKLINNRYEEV